MNSTLQLLALYFITETAIWLLGKDKTLGTRKEINDMTCLHLLAKMPSAFRSSCNMSKMQRLLYHCMSQHDPNSCVIYLFFQTSFHSCLASSTNLKAFLVQAFLAIWMLSMTMKTIAMMMMVMKFKHHQVTVKI